MPRTFAQIAKDIKAAWGSKIDPYAKSYLNALMEINSSDRTAKYYMDDAEEITLRFLINATSFRGTKARHLKQELKDLIKV